MNELDRLREMARKRRSAVTGKIARIRRNTGVDITGGREDPRKPVKAVERLNTKQLNKYISDLNAFQSRSVGYVAGSGGVPIPKSKWQEYKRMERQFNAIGAKHDAKVADIFLPTHGMTIRERAAMIHPTAVGEVVNSPYARIDREPRQIHSADALDKLIRDMNRRTSKNYLPRELKNARKQMNDMLKTAGLGDMMKRAAGLSDSQFDTAWNYTNMANTASLVYEIMRMRSADAKERWHDSVLEDSRNELGDLFNFAESLPRDGKQPKQAKKQTKKRTR